MSLFSSKKGADKFDSDIYYKMMILVTENRQT